jgi:K+ transporter
MTTNAKIGVAAHASTAHAWAPAALASMGVVFGDVGTSPLYALSVAAKTGSGPNNRAFSHPGAACAPSQIATSWGTDQ